MSVGPREAALGYVGRGWPVLPCHHMTAGGCSCGRADCSSPGKHPRTRTGLTEATTDPDQVARWWRRWPQSNVGIRTGAESALVVVDVDPGHDGVASLRALVDQHDRLPSGLRVRTGSGGWHLYFAHPGGVVANSAGRLGPGLDMRGDGGYVIAPPSNHRSGGAYSFVDADAPVPEMPEWLDRLVRPPERRVERDPIHIGEAVDAWVRAAVLAEAERVRTAPAGSRNATLNRAAFSLGQIAAAGIVDADTIRSILTENSLGAGLGEHEIYATIGSGLAAGLRHPRGPRERHTSGAEIAP